ncbi:MAG: hypothetical protein KJ893_04615, partial [Candidatus Omnitrophica bacterium]|nr:hypothetical protein [Candidatus Omnitrophota bacterium]MCG2703620.1 hypothetical protein [Candidatus Omnitrophota bacterium]
AYSFVVLRQSDPHPKADGLQKYVCARRKTINGPRDAFFRPYSVWIGISLSAFLTLRSNNVKIIFGFIKVYLFKILSTKSSK